MAVDLVSNEVHIWIASINEVKNNNDLNYYLNLLSGDEVERYSRFVFEKDRQRFLVTRALVRIVLSEYVSVIRPEEWIFEQNKYGKPAIAVGQISYPLKFNITHSNNIIGLAITSDVEIGIDVERINSEIATPDLATHTFSSSELIQLQNTDCFSEHFFQLWTLKEAYIKACGMGLSIPLDTFSILCSKREKFEIQFHGERKDDPNKWHFWQFKPSEGYIASVAIKSINQDKNHKLIIREAIF
uniref:4'-phosphopantetheinyl transferase n=1 Tax=Marinomonas sp. (strain MWYL1) TaxID=400668 RepID=A6VYG5_MARMS